jgi:hypothetical protein
MFGTEGASLKKPWDRNSQVKRLQLDAPLERAVKPPKEKLPGK